MNLINTLAGLTPYSVDSSDDQLEDAVATLNRLIQEAKAYQERTVTEQLEAMIDKHDLTYVVAGLVLVCGEKAAHIRENWQDCLTARRWERDGELLDRALRNIHN